MSVASDHYGRDHVTERPRRQDGDASVPDSAQPLWQWVAVGLLVLCWIVEAAMCADRGF